MAVLVDSQVSDRCPWATCSPVESELDLDLGYIENVLMDFDSKHLQTQDSGGCHLGTLGQLSEFNMASKMVGNCKGHTVLRSGQFNCYCNM